MKPSHYIEKVKKSNAYKLLIEEDPNAYLCSLFFLRDFDEGNNETQVDFYSPLKKHLVSFKVGKQVEKVENKHAKTLTNKKLIPRPLPENIKMDVDEMKPTILDEMHNRDMTYEIEKVLAFLNVADGRPVWNCTGFLKGLGLIQAHVEDKSASVLFMEKKSLFDLIKFPGGAPGMGMPSGPSLAGQEKPMGNVVLLNKQDQQGPAAQTADEAESKPEAKPKTQKAEKQEPAKKKEAKESKAKQ